MATGERGRGDERQPASASPPEEVGAAPAWEEIESGRFRPRRIRGSMPGRELG